MDSEETAEKLRKENKDAKERKKELGNEQLEGVNGGVDAAAVAGMAFDVYGLIHRPDATRRGTKDGSKRFK